MPQKVFIARNSLTNLHSIFEVVPSDWGDGRTSALELKQANSLISWTEVGELVGLLEEFGPFIASDLCEGVPRMFPIDDVIEIAESRAGRGEERFVAADADMLWMQMYIDGQVGRYPSRASVQNAAQQYSLIDRKSANELKAWRTIDPKCMVAVEPLADLTAVRNLASILLRVIANYQTGSTNPLTDSGFVRYDPNFWKLLYKEIKVPYLMVPFRHNVGIDGTLTLSGKWWRNASLGAVSNSLCWLIGTLRPKNSKLSFGNAIGVIDVSAQIANGRVAPLINVAVDYAREDTRKYLGIVDTGDERACARHLVESVARVMSGLKTVKGIPIGWTLGCLSDMNDNDSPKPLFHTLAGAIIGSVLLRYGAIPVTCKNCGSGMLVSPKGKRREFCSNSCKTQYSAKYRSERLASDEKRSGI